MGDAQIHSKAAEQENQVKSTYTVLAYPGSKLPEQYRNLVYAKTLRCLHRSNDFFRLVDANDFYFTYQNYLAQLLQHTKMVVRLAVLSDDRDIVLGFSLARGSILDFVYVHKDHRRARIGTHLLPDGITTISHLTKVGMMIWATKYANWKFNPFK